MIVLLLGNVPNNITSREQYEKENNQPFLRGVCSQLWHSPQINFDEKLLGCCVNYWGDYGNIFEDGSVVKTFNNAKINYARMMLLGKSPAKKDIPCSTCSIYKKCRKQRRGIN